MITFAALLFGLGCCLIVGGAVAALLRWYEANQRRILERAALVPCADWQAGRRWQAAAGMTTAGPTGVQISPVTGTACAWYAVDLVREPSRRYDDTASSVDHLWTQEAPGPPALQDHTGSLLIDPRLLRRRSTDGDPLITTTTVRRYGREDEDRVPQLIPRDVYLGTGKHETLVLTKLLVHAGQRAYAIGRARSDGGNLVLTPSRRGPVTVLTTGTYEQVHARRIAATAGSWTLPGALSIAGVAGIAGAVLLAWLTWPVD